MRYSCLLLSAWVLLSGGCCSVMIAESGKDVSALTTRELVRQEFGEPKLIGVARGGSFDEYRTHRLIKNPSPGLGLTLGMTFGMAEWILLPCELYRLGRITLLGQSLCFTYDADGTVTGVFLDGEPLSFWWAR